MISITRSYEISAGHHLPLHEGKCRFPHGHNYVIEVSVTKPMLETQGSSTGMIMDFTDLDAVVKFRLEELDHKDLNEVLEGTDYFPPTAENIARWLFNELNDQMLFAIVWKVRVYETRNSFVEVTE